MHKYLGDWYTIVKITPDDDLLRKRGQAIENILKSIDISAGLDLLRLFYIRPLKNVSFVENFRKSFHDVDAAFSMRDNDLELAILAGSIIADYIESNNSNLSDTLALATICANFKGLYSPLIEDIIAIANNYLTTRSSQIRSFTKIQRAQIPILEVSTDLQNLQATCGSGNLSTIAQPLIGSLQKIVNIVNEINKSQETIDYITMVQGLLQEETNILWWLFGEYSRGLEKRMADIGLQAACLVSGKELSDLTIILPGPLSAKAILDKMLRLVERDLPDSITLKEAVNMSPTDWRSKWMSGLKCTNSVEGLCPVLLAVLKSLETTGEDEWLPAFVKAAKITGTENISPLDLAMQVYQENLLCRLVMACS